MASFIIPQPLEVTEGIREDTEFQWYEMMYRYIGIPSLEQAVDASIRWLAANQKTTVEELKMDFAWPFGSGPKDGPRMEGKEVSREGIIQTVKETGWCQFGPFGKCGFVGVQSKEHYEEQEAQMDDSLKRHCQESADGSGLVCSAYGSAVFVLPNGEQKYERKITYAVPQLPYVRKGTTWHRVADNYKEGNKPITSTVCGKELPAYDCRYSHTTNGLKSVKPCKKCERTK